MKKLITLLLLTFTLNLCATAIDAVEEIKIFKETKKAAERGDAYSQLSLGKMYYAGHGVTADKKQAFYWHKKSAEQGNAKAQSNLGWMYFFGKGIIVNKKKAAYWIKKSSEGGNEEAKEKWKELELEKYQ